MDGEARILVVDDDPNLTDVVSRYLNREGFTVVVEHDGPSGLARALAWLPDLVVLDVMLPGMDGLAVCRALRAQAPIPVVMLTARAEEDDRVAGLDLGADDYLAKPFSPRELTARVKAVLRRARGPVAAAEPAVWRAADIEVDLVAHEARRSGQPLALTVKEFDLLAHLMKNPNRAFSREELLEQVWGWTYGDTATVTVHMRRLREKVERDPSNPVLLATVWGVGYRLDLTTGATA